MTACRGSVVLHGYTHQYRDIDNPYDGVSGNDFEFFRAHVDENNFVQLGGPVAEDSPEWIRERLQAAHAELEAVGLTRPEIFEFPQYVASAADYRVVAEECKARYDQAQYFPGVLTGDKPDYRHMGDQFVPYPIRDVYGSFVVPENLGQVTLSGYNQHPPRLPADVLKTTSVRFKSKSDKWLQPGNVELE